MVLEERHTRLGAMVEGVLFSVKEIRARDGSAWV